MGLVNKWFLITLKKNCFSAKTDKAALMWFKSMKIRNKRFMNLSIISCVLKSEKNTETRNQQKNMQYY